MPPVRLHRRRSSIAIALNPIKAGFYGIHTPSPRAVTFAPNVTPGTYIEPEGASSSSTTPEPASPTATLFPPSDAPTPPPARRRVPPGKRRSLGYIPRPPNAFMLFRADFVRQKHVPGSIETNHGSLSKIIGNCWRSLPLEEKRVWEIRAKHAKAEHKARYPEYRFRPVHNKNKDKKKDKPTPTADDERRCEEVAQLLLEGKKGEELAQAIQHLDKMRNHTPVLSSSASGFAAHITRRSSSVPPPDSRFNTIAIPSLPFLTGPRADSPVGNISRANRMFVGQRRASSAGPPMSRVPLWTSPPMSTVLRDDSPLPEVDTSLFEPSFLDSNFSFSMPSEPPFNFNEFLATLPPQARSSSANGISPFDLMTSDPSLQYHTVKPAFFHANPSFSWLPTRFTHSGPSSVYSGSPAHSDMSLPVLAPQPQHTESFDLWGDLTGAFQPIPPRDGEQHVDLFPSFDNVQTNGGLGPEMSIVSGEQHVCAASTGVIAGADSAALQGYSTSLEGLFDNAFSGVDVHAGAAISFDYNDMIHEF